MDDVHAAEKLRLSGKSWIQTHSGKQFFPLAPRPEDVCIDDIAHALSQKVRFTGHCSRLYTVGQHSLLVSEALPSSFKLAGLLHDATEAYLPDVAAPIKGHVRIETPEGLKTFAEVENRLADVIFEALGLSSIRALIDSPEIKRADLTVLATEVSILMGDPPDDWRLPYPPDSKIYIGDMKPDRVKADFLAAYGALT